MDILFTVLGINNVETLAVLWLFLGFFSVVYTILVKIGNERVLGCIAWILGTPTVVLWLVVTVQIVRLVSVL